MAMTEGLANTVLLKNTPHRSFRAFRDAPILPPTVCLSLKQRELKNAMTH